MKPDLSPPRWSAAQAAAAGRDFAELHAAHGGVLWVEFDPAKACCALFLQQGEVRSELTPPGYSVRSKVYEYGGGACCATAKGAAFVNERDQQVYHVALGGEQPQALTTRPACRYGDLNFVLAWQALLAVEESREGRVVVHRIVRIGLDGSREVLVQGCDFYASPTADSRGQRLVWIEWSRPALPWTSTRLCQRLRALEGSWGPTQVLAGNQGDESLQQPRFSVDGQLYCLSDRQGCWQPWYEEQGELHPLRDCPDFDHAPAPWQLGTRSYLLLEEGELLLNRLTPAGGLLLARSGRGWERLLAEEFSRFRALAADTEHFYCVAASPSRLPALLAIRRDDLSVHVVAGGEQPLAEPPLPEALQFTVGKACTHGFFYPPREGELPPLVVFLHGGPTSACYPVFDPRIAYWCERGFAVLDLNYRGSAGYGRAYRQCLRNEWGHIEVEDIAAAVTQLGRDGRIDPDRVFVRGASAGGYSALCALIELPGLRGGASLYGVSDPQALRRVTHKFEADYLDWLLGDPQQQAARYLARTPLQQVARLKVPVIFFQGGCDAVVVPQQTASMVEALRSQGVAVEYHYYPDEGHGFRQAEHLAQALEREYQFYSALL